MTRTIDFHQIRRVWLSDDILRRELSVRFRPHFHPFVDALSTRLVSGSVAGLQDADTETVDDGSGSAVPALYSEMFGDPGTSDGEFTPAELVDLPYPVKDLDFESDGAYSVYNWEMFYHAPLAIAMHLTKNQRYADAQRWLHYLFDPTDDGDGETPDRFWKVKPFRGTEVQLIDEIIRNLNSDDPDVDLLERTIDCMEAWKEAPFRPHVVARYRPSAYMVKALMAYLDNLIEWGDNLFRQDTIETINEATQLYILAANLLGERPLVIPQTDSTLPKTYADLVAARTAAEDAAVNLENEIAFGTMAFPKKEVDGQALATLRSLGFGPYFCVPFNDRLLTYWDTVADRLFKIRNSLNIRGIFRQLPLWDPPIDPALLVRATAAGLDISSIVSGLNQPLPLVRFRTLVAKASEICQEVKSLGANLLSAIEKEDGEAMAILRARHERAVLELSETVKYGQLQEATKSREGLEQSLANAIQRYVYYERLLGTEEDEIQIPELEELDADALDRMKLRVDEPSMVLRPIEIDLATDNTGGRKISSGEAKEMKQLADAQNKEKAASIIQTIASAMAQIPDFGTKAQPNGIGADIRIGGQLLSTMLSASASSIRTVAGQKQYEASKTGRMAGYKRREQEWAFQSNTVAGEITQTFKQLRAAQIREALAAKEWSNHKKQMENAEEIERFLTDEKKGKTSQKSLYTWMKREVRGLYNECFQFAYDVAKKAEVAARHELGDPTLSFLQYGYQSGKQGLLAGDKLHLDIRRMEMAYHDLNEREYELTKHVSLRQLDPAALVALRTTGSCSFDIDEEVFELDCPGHYFRRIKSVAVTVPCVTGPYTTVHCRLALTSSRIRTTPQLQGMNYAYDGTEDPRFSVYRGAVQSVVTSTAQGDSGLFETNLQDERYLPFEGAGAVGAWSIDLPANPADGDPQTFDYDSISDVILHVRYTAREGGQVLRNEAKTHLENMIETAGTYGDDEVPTSGYGTTRLFSVRHEFPTQWAALRSGASTLTLTMSEEHYPYWSLGRLGKEIRCLEMVAQTTNTSVGVTWNTGRRGGPLELPAINDMYGPGTRGWSQAWDSEQEPRSYVLPGPADDLEFTITGHMTDDPDPVCTIDDLWLAVTWGGHPPTS